MNDIFCIPWLKDTLDQEGFNTNPKVESFNEMPKWKQDKVKLRNYIFNIQDALQMELGERE